MLFRWKIILTALAIAGATGLAGCRAHTWRNDHGNMRITSDPPEAFPDETPRMWRGY